MLLTRLAMHGGFDIPRRPPATPLYWAFLILGN